MPLFHGLGVASSHTHEAIGLEAVMWLMLAFFALPLLAMMACIMIPSLFFRRIHFAMTLLYTVLNLAHLIMDELVSVPGYQLVLMFLLLFVGIVLNIISYQWMNQLVRTKKRPELFK
ncbi:hypothetical protein [Synechococcus sp. PCC 7335]|uniref:hypothetical protein n=1 Tax=Synechococcus sp. (strain ATCC 29403 / PCC 7335) TaxID=91464 RepID=UPI00031CDB18|nr:hypothetical protein [Synechococcus sp. PCC 7335]